MTSHILTDHLLNVRSIDEEIMDFVENNEYDDTEDIFKCLEDFSWEENRYVFINKQNNKREEMDIDEESRNRQKLQDKICQE